MLHGIMNSLVKSFVSLSIKNVYQNICLFFWLRLRRNVRYPDIQEVHVLNNLLKLFRKPVYVPSLVHVHVVHTLPVIGFYVLES